MPEPSDNEELLASLVEDYLAAMRNGDAPALESYVEAHPECSAELRELLKSVVEMESLSASTHSTTPGISHYPESLGGYRLLERIGTGGMGTVFRAMQESLHREVAVKILSPAWNADERHCEAFENESRVIAALHHTNIVEVFGAGQEGEYRYYVMSLVEGQGVTPACIRKAFPGIPYEEAVARVGLQAAQALAYAHSCGVLHRDVKPGNLLLNTEGILRVSDFGLATLLNSGEMAPLVTQSHDGTLRYMPPERLLKGVNSFAGDQYSLGVTLYELVSNKPAFRETEPGKLIQRICNEPLKALRGEGELGAIINKSICFDPAERYASMADMVADLRRYLNGEPVLARPASWLRRYGMWMRRRPAVALWSHAAALLVFLLFGSILWGYAGENAQRRLAERNATIADAALQQIFTNMANRDSGDDMLWQPTRADAQLLQQLMPYYEEIAALADSRNNKMAAASYTLAIIALQIRDYPMARNYFLRARENTTPASLDYVRATNGLCSALYALNERELAESYLKELVKDVKPDCDAEVRLEIVRSLQMLSAGNRYSRRWQPGLNALHRGFGGDRPPHRHISRRQEQHRERMAYMQQAVELMQQLVIELPDNESVQMRRVELLSQPMRPELRHMLLAEGERMEELLDSLLLRYPDNRLIKRAYVQWSMRPHGEKNLEMLRRAARYTRNLLAEDPGSSEMLMLYLATRDRYSSALSAEGYQEHALRENEMTLGVLSLVTSRGEYTAEMRERLAILVSMHPQAEEDRSQQEAEISLLLEDHDSKRLQEVRDRIQEMRRQWRHRHHHRPPRPFGPFGPRGHRPPPPPPHEQM